MAGVETQALERIQRNLERLDLYARAKLALDVRERYGMTQADFAVFMGTTESTVSRRERAAMDIPDEVVRALMFADTLHRAGLEP